MYYILHILISISSHFWCKFHTDIWNTQLNNTYSICANTPYTLKKHILIQRPEFGNVIFAPMPLPYPTDLYTSKTGQRITVIFTSTLPHNLVTHLTNISTSIHVYLHIWQTNWCLCLTDIWHKKFELMKGRKKPYITKHKNITKNWNYDGNCTHISRFQSKKF